MPSWAQGGPAALSLIPRSFLLNIENQFRYSKFAIKLACVFYFIFLLGLFLSLENHHSFLMCLKCIKIADNREAVE